MASSTLAFFDQMNGVNYQSLSTKSFQLGIVDPDSSALTSSQISSLEASGKTMIGYLSVGEAENYRSYWQSSWNNSPPSWILAQNPNWPGNYNVKYWDPAWQKIVINEATAMAKAGYNGVMLDVVDAYTVSAVAAADGGITKARNDMISFVEKIAAATKAVNPNFKIIQNNALDLLTVNPDDPSSATNSAYLSHIDGVVAESTFYNPDNTATSWGSWNTQYLKHAVSAGKDVLAIDYPTSSTAQQSFITHAIGNGFVPFVGTQDLSSIPSVNSQIPAKLVAHALAELTGHTIPPVVITGSGGGTVTPPPVTQPGTLVHMKVTPNTGDHTYDASLGNDDFVFYKHTGNTTINNFVHGNILDIESKIYASADQAVSHIVYSGGNATLALDGHNNSNSITITGVVANSLTASDFHIFT